jgi:hypothetical protein
MVYPLLSSPTATHIFVRTNVVVVVVGATVVVVGALVVVVVVLIVYLFKYIFEYGISIHIDMYMYT